MAHTLDKYPLSKESFDVKKEKDSSGKYITTYTCLFSGEKFSYKEGDSKGLSDLTKFNDACKNARTSGESSVSEKDISGYKQAPDDKWILTSNSVRYGITKSPNSKIVKDPSSAEFKKESVVDGKLVYLRENNGIFNAFIKSNASGEYKYFPLKDSSGKTIIEPYYPWIVANPSKAADKLATAKTKVDKDILALIESGKYSYGFAGGRYGSSKVYGEDKMNAIGDRYGSSKVLDMSQIRSPRGKAYGLHMVNPYNNPNAIMRRKIKKSGIDGKIDIINANLIDDDEFSPASGENYSNGIGDFFKKVGDYIRGGKERRERRRLSREEAKKLELKVASPEVQEYSAIEVESLYDNSGTSKPFKEWVKSDNAKSFLKNLASAGYMLLLNNQQQQESRDENTLYDDNEKDSGDKSSSDEKKILGMHPVTFGIVGAVVLLAGIGITVYVMRKKSK